MGKLTFNEGEFKDELYVDGFIKSNPICLPLYNELKLAGINTENYLFSDANLYKIFSYFHDLYLSFIVDDGKILLPKFEKNRVDILKKKFKSLKDGIENNDFNDFFEGDWVVPYFLFAHLSLIIPDDINIFDILIDGEDHFTFIVTINRTIYRLKF